MSLFESYEKIYPKESSKNKFITKEGLTSELYDSVKDDDGVNRINVGFQKKNTSKKSTILKKEEKDVEKLKKDILGNKSD